MEEQNDVSAADWIWQRVRLISPPPHEDKELREAFDKFVSASSTEALSVYAATPDPVKHKLLRYGREPIIKDRDANRGAGLRGAARGAYREFEIKGKKGKS